MFFFALKSVPYAFENRTWVPPYENKILLGELGRPKDCAGASLYFVDHTIVIDGGLTVGQVGRV